MLPRLQAEESLAALVDRRLAAGSYEQFDAQSIIGTLQTQARGGEPVRATPASAAQLAAMGIAVVEIASPPSEEHVSHG